MKKSLLIALCCSMLFVPFVSAETETQADIHLLAGRDQSIRPTSINSSVIPMTASVDGDLLSVNFSSNLGATTITIESPSGELIYENILDVQSGVILPISLAGAEEGTYYIEIRTASKKWYGEFDM